MNILQTNTFRNTAKKLHKKEKKVVDEAVRFIMKNPRIGERKKGVLARVHVYKFSMNQQQTLLAYSFDSKTKTITLLALGSHENFYRDLER